MNARQMLIPGKPVRIQRSRAKGWRMPDNTVYVGRPTKWGNPMKIGEDILACGEPVVDGYGPLVQRKATAEDCIRFYRKTFGKLPSSSFEALRGKNLACWCPLDQPCHADVLLELANKPGATP